MNVNDVLHGSIAAALVQAGLSFQTNTGKTGRGEATRVFQIPFELPGGLGSYMITSYVGGAAIVALAPFLITSEPPMAKRHEISDFLVARVPFLRVQADLRKLRDSPNIAWLEASIPIPQDSGSVDPSTAIAPINSIAAAMESLRSAFAEHTAIVEPQDVPLYFSALRAGSPATT